VSLVEQELLTLPEHMSSPPGFSGVRVTRSFVWCVCFVDRWLSFCTFLLAIVLAVLLRYTDSDYLPFVSSNCISIEILQYTKGVTKSSKSNKDRQYNGQNENGKGKRKDLKTIHTHHRLSNANPTERRVMPCEQMFWTFPHFENKQLCVLK
jgi:hypothetical protein